MEDMTGKRSQRKDYWRA